MNADSYPARKAVERGKSYSQQVWETVYVSVGVCLAVYALHVLGWL